MQRRAEKKKTKYIHRANGIEKAHHMQRTNDGRTEGQRSGRLKWMREMRNERNCENKTKEWSRRKKPCTSYKIENEWFGVRQNKKISEQPITNGLKAKGDAIKRFSLLLHYLLEFVFLSVGRSDGWLAGRSVCVHIWPTLTHLLIPSAASWFRTNRFCLAMLFFPSFWWTLRSALMCLRLLFSFVFFTSVDHCSTEIIRNL